MARSTLKRTRYPRSPGEMVDTDREAYQVASRIGHPFSAAEFKALYRKHFPTRNIGSIFRSDHCVDHENKGIRHYPRSRLGHGRYEFVGLQRAPGT
jgi:hypothetical protein